MKIISLLALCFLSFSCAHPSQKKLERVTIMTFNLQNLFDTKDDKGKDDSTFLPLKLKQTVAHKNQCKKARFKKWQSECLNLDWNDKVLARKMTNLAKAIQQVNAGMGPDILLLQEVENLEVLKRLNEEHSLGYKEILLIEGKDLRGIDVAIMSKLKSLSAPQLSYVDFSTLEEDRKVDTRGILQGDFRLPNGEILTVFSAHFPAPFHPVKMREESLQHLNKLLKKLPKDRIVVAGGDFNIPSEEDKKTRIFQKLAQDHWLIAHKEACKSCRGTTYFSPKKSWSFLDILLVSKNIKTSKTWQLDPTSIRVPNKSTEQVDVSGHPKPFDAKEKQGVSDHWPFALDLVLRKAD